MKFVGEVQLAQDLNQELPADGRDRGRGGAPRRSRACDRPRGAVEGKPTTFHDNQILVGKPYNLLNPWQRIAVSLGGPFANFLSRFAAFAVIGCAQGVPQAQEVFVRGVIAGEAADRAGLQGGRRRPRSGRAAVETAQDIIWRPS